MSFFPLIYSSTGQFVGEGESNSSWSSTSSFSYALTNDWETGSSNTWLCKTFRDCFSLTECQAWVTHLMAVSTLADLTIYESLSLVSSIFDRTKRRNSFLYWTALYIPKSISCICDVELNIFLSTHGDDNRYYPFAGLLIETVMTDDDSILKELHLISLLSSRHLPDWNTLLVIWRYLFPWSTSAFCLPNSILNPSSHISILLL